MSHARTLSPTAVEPIEPPTEEHQPQEQTDHVKVDGAPDQHGWWDDADVFGLIGQKAFCRSLYGCDQLLENSNSNDDDDEAIPCTSDINTESALDKQTRLGRSPSTKG